MLPLFLQCMWNYSAEETTIRVLLKKKKEKAFFYIYLPLSSISIQKLDSSYLKHSLHLLGCQLEHFQRNEPEGAGASKHVSGEFRCHSKKCKLECWSGNTLCGKMLGTVVLKLLQNKDGLLWGTFHTLGHEEGYLYLIQSISDQQIALESKDLVLEFDKHSIICSKCSVC